MGEVIDSVKITYLLTNGTHKLATHGGPGGKLAFETPVHGNIYFVLEHSNLFTRLE
jgi:hypothetical protein